MQHISGLWGTSWIYIDISTFLEKLFKVILFLIIPIDSIKYLVSYFFLLSARPQAGKFFFFLRLLWKCKTQILIVLCSIYTQGCMIIKNGISFICGAADSVKNVEKDSQTQCWDRWKEREERHPTKGTHKTTTKRSGCFPFHHDKLVNRHTTSDVPLIEVYNVRMHCESMLKCVYSLCNLLHARLQSYTLDRNGIKSG